MIVIIVVRRFGPKQRSSGMLTIIIHMPHAITCNVPDEGPFGPKHHTTTIIIITF